MRKKKNRESRLAACSDWLMEDPQTNDFIKNEPIELEIGCGKGTFICQTALQNPNKQYFAVELSTDALINALEKAKEYNIPNLHFINVNAERLGDYFKKGDVSVIYLNFSDPWPKAKHAKRRLTYRSFLSLYQSILSENGKICLKTDNRALFDFSIEEFQSCGWRIEKITYDLHNSPYQLGNIMTEYEKNFSEKGFPIHRLEAFPPSEK
jgi:tRNA (guanine-N7-)-methyltransferase